MGGQIPLKTKEKVLKLHLSGLGRKKIADATGIGEGTVASIVDQARENIHDIDLLRAAAIELKKKGWDLKVFSAAVRHRNFLYRKGLSDNQIDELLENLDEHCFKEGIPIPSLLALVQNISSLTKKYEYPLDKLQEFIEQKQAELAALDRELGDARLRRSDLFVANKVTEKELIEYKQNIPLLETLDRKEREIELLKSVAREMEPLTLSPFLPKGMTQEYVKEAAKLMIRNAPELISEIKSIHEKAPPFRFAAIGLNPNFEAEE